MRLRRSLAAMCGLSAAFAGLPPSAAARAHSPPGIVVTDLAYGEVLYHFYQQDYLTALTHLLAAQARGELTANADEADLLLGGLYLSYGEHDEAAAIFERVLAGTADPGVRDRAWYFLAEIRYQRGYPVKAEAALGRIEGELSSDLEPKRRLLEAQLLMDQGRFEDARQRLASWKKPAEPWVGYAKYNLGVALVRLGRVAEGARVLGEVGTLETADPSLLALRDKADIALGYTWLRAGKPAAAKPALERVRLEGPFSSQALLGVGWADAALSQYRAALAPWIELSGRDPLDPAVQESLLAVPYAYRELGADRQAADGYAASIAKLDGEIERLDKAMAAVKSGKFLESLFAAGGTHADGWYWRLDQLPDTDGSRYLYDLVSTDRFQEALKNCRDLEYLLQNLDRWDKSLDAFDDILDTRQRAFEQRGPRIDAGLEAADLDAMEKHRAELESRLGAIEANGDIAALGTPKQQQMWRKLSGMEADLARLQGAKEVELREKQRFLKGVLQWDLDHDYEARLSAEKKSLEQTGRDIDEARQRRRNVVDARDGWPGKFKALTARIGTLEPRLKALRDAVSTEYMRQQAFLVSLAGDHLADERRRLDGYRIQARFAVAEIYDQAATATGRATVGAETLSGAADGAETRSGAALSAKKRTAASAGAETRSGAEP
ncbi:MAG TPA: tetratricopeptide repeat protein [Gammaproteobacteria bacterium]|nr:tetratricopeptide repeat protein [Gammaproteobacteria bacterium]